MRDTIEKTRIDSCLEGCKITHLTILEPFRSGASYFVVPKSFFGGSFVRSFAAS